MLDASHCNPQVQRVRGHSLAGRLKALLPQQAGGKLLLTEYVRYLQDQLLLHSVTSVQRLLRAVSCSFVYHVFLAFHTE